MKRHLLLSIIVLFSVTLFARERKNFDENWRFVLADSAKMSSNDYNDASWRVLDLPHDWAIEGDFLASNPSGAGGGALPGGIGWYRKHFKVDNAKGDNSRYYIEFDGVYMNSTVFINGHELGMRPYGYSSFRYELTPYLNMNGDNVIAVRVDNSDQPNSRWYSGCGIYRHVWLVETAQVSVAHWGTYVTASVDAKGKAVFSVSVELDNNTGKNVNAKVKNSLIDASGKVKASSMASVKINEKGKSIQKLTLNNPILWSTDNPYIYNVKTEVIVGGKTIDTYYTTTGVRTFVFDAEKGFSLNGKSMKINGVCQHHDLGSLGAALNEDALYRQLRMLKEMGCNAIRCSHNPPAPELLNMCDTMGLIVMDESFDMWRKKKTQNDYARFFDKWYERDLSDLVVRDRNHPSIIMWSIGNEVLEQWSSADADTLSLEQANLILNFGHDASSLAKDGEMSVNSLLAKRLVEVVKSLDPTRPVTAGCNEPDPGNHLFKSGALDIIGFNYHNEYIKGVPQNFPGKPFILTESVSAIQTRGFYRMPSDSIVTAPKEWWISYTDPSYMCSSYDNNHVPWGATHEATWDIVKHSPFCSGQFIWTGWDYIGEPTPYAYPARSSYFGIIDLAGFPKDVYYMYQSEWTDKTVLHLFPHWNWLEGQTIDLWCYYNNADEVELYINGKSQGIRRKADSHQYHVMWRVTFEPGEVKAVSRKNGSVVATRIIKTAGAPDHIRLTSDKTVLTADGKSLAFVTVEVVDKDGNLCPNAENQIFFDVSGNAKIAGVDNGSQTSLERFKANNRKAMFGKCLVVVQADKTSGTAKLTAKGIDLKTASVSFDIK
ncbi:MAG: glycoside hydrolase family 2 TIM barrel-domain containing protein [Prevotellaceae bacterium]|nr:glycoside hydrolase family 2 TIM barrel-domain containing protein [Prevotellaceae bacterium]